jgi:hypothetical protein
LVGGWTVAGWLSLVRVWVVVICELAYLGSTPSES